MNSISKTKFNRLDGVLYYGALHWGRLDLLDPDYLQNNIIQDCKDSGVDYQEFVDSKVVLIFLAEGHDHKDVEPVIKLFNQTHPNRFMILFNSVVDTKNLSYPALSVSDWLIKGNHTWDLHKDFDFDSIAPEKKFLCLLRRPSVSRAQLAAFLAEEIGLDNVLLSFASQGEYAYKGYQQYFTKHQLPILVDGFVSNGEMFYDVIYKPQFYSCFFNVIAESSSQSDYECYKSVFITEKTWKCIMQHQLPIWYGVPGLAAHMRSLGFDVFDDILNSHSYDTVQDEATRYAMVFDLIAGLNQKYSLEDCMVLRTQLRSRLEANYLHFKDREKMILPRIKQYILEFYNH